VELFAAFIGFPRWHVTALRNHRDLLRALFGVVKIQQRKRRDFARAMTRRTVAERQSGAMCLLKVTLPLGSGT
jgi:hypothetical protein